MNSHYLINNKMHQIFYKKILLYKNKVHYLATLIYYYQNEIIFYFLYTLACE